MIPLTDRALIYSNKAYNNYFLGNYNEALAILKLARDDCPTMYCNKACKSWVNTLGQILFQITYYRSKIYLHSGHDYNAKSVITQWISFCENDPLNSLVASTKHAQILDKQGNRNLAISILKKVISNKDTRCSFLICRLEGMLLLTDIYMVLKCVI
jgi:tetratricopeptide (TPR) repeat protein